MPQSLIEEKRIGAMETMQRDETERRREMQNERRKK
jgi:hypothetical protein